MSRHIDFEAVNSPHANNDNHHPAHCIEVFTPGVGWSIHVDIGTMIERFTLDEFIHRIWALEKGRRNRRYLDRAKDMRVCLGRIGLFMRGAA